MTYVLTDLYGKQHEVDGWAQRGDLLFATLKDEGYVPIYSIRYDNEFERYCKDHINDNEDIRDCRSGDNQGQAR